MISNSSSLLDITTIDAFFGICAELPGRLLLPTADDELAGGAIAISPSEAADAWYGMRHDPGVSSVTTHGRYSSNHGSRRLCRIVRGC